MPAYDDDHWKQLWERTLRDHPDKVASRRPSAYLTGELAGLPAGRVLDAGCGHGAEALWLAGRGWQVTAVDFARAALDFGAHTAEALGPHVAARIDWVEGDLGSWAPTPGAFDLVLCLYVHVAGPMDAFLARMAAGVAPGGHLFLVGHQPVDPATGLPTRASGQTQVAVRDADVLPAERWERFAVEERTRPDGNGADAVLHLIRR